MTTARSIIDEALTRLNKLGIGESADTATDTICLRGLNSLVDEFNGAKSMLHREILTASGSAISAATAVLGTAWSSLAPGDKILGATYVASGEDNPMWELTMAQYQAIPDKTETGEPQFWAHDGLATVYFSPVPTSHTITLRTKAVFSDFADATTDYSMPKGYKSAFAALLAEWLAPIMGGWNQSIGTNARAARLRLLASNVNPAIVNTGYGRPNIERGW